MKKAGVGRLVIVENLDNKAGKSGATSDERGTGGGIKAVDFLVFWFSGSFCI
jgi:hypothetical protein